MSTEVKRLRLTAATGQTSNVSPSDFLKRLSLVRRTDQWTDSVHYFSAVARSLFSAAHYKLAKNKPFK
jgi:hypothetical protein